MDRKTNPNKVVHFVSYLIMLFSLGPNTRHNIYRLNVRCIYRMLDFL